MPEGWPGAWFLTDPQRVPDPVAAIAGLPPGTGVIYRHFGAVDRLVIARNLRQATLKRGLPLLLANDAELAKQVRADGVHWPEAQAHKARHWQGAFFYQTQSVHSTRGLREAVCDAVLFSTVFPSNSPSAGEALGALRFRKLAQHSDKLVYALGGVNGETAGAVSAHSGVAGIEGFVPSAPHS